MSTTTDHNQNGSSVTGNTDPNGTDPASQPPTGAGVDTGAGITREKTEAEKEADRLYEERIEEEYAKRDGGA